MPCEIVTYDPGITDRECACGVPLAGRRERFCAVCRIERERARNRARRQHEDFLKNNIKRRRSRGARFVAIDGEGVQTQLPDPRAEGYLARHRAEHVCDNNCRTCGCLYKSPEFRRHDYVMLSVGDQTLCRDGANLETLEIFEHLYSCFERGRKDAVYVGYYLAYDFCMWLRGLPENRAHMLYTSAGIAARAPASEARKQNPVPFPVRWENWEFDMLPNGKRFKLRRYEETVNRGIGDWMYICDVGPFFQCSFLSAISGEWIDPDGNAVEIATREEREIIARGKSQRATAGFSQEMLEYNVAENRVLSRVMGALDVGFQRLGVRLAKTRWFGPGQLAQAHMSLHNSHTRLALLDAYAGKRDILDAAGAAYYGGWFEITRHGHVGDVYDYDIASAYPHIHSRLPCMLHGRWNDDPGAAYALVNAHVLGSNPYLGVHPYRDSKDNIFRPHEWQGWAWIHELEAAKRAGLIDGFHVKHAHGYTPCGCSPPSAYLIDMYEQRQAVGKGSSYGRALKLGMNSPYGKTAQSVGTPKFGNALHASMITAGTRVMILDAIASHPVGAAAVTMIATDGICFDSEHSTLNVAPGLGNWEAAFRKNLTQMMPGVYWDDGARENRKHALKHLKSRGIRASDLLENLNKLDDEWREFAEMIVDIPFLTGLPDSWPRLKIPISFSLVSPKQSIQRGGWGLTGATRGNETRDISGYPGLKRNIATARVEREAIYTVPRQHLAMVDINSRPYRGTFGANADEQELLTPDGDAHEAIQGFVIRGE